MVICYGRSFLLSARYWWKDLAQNIKPVIPTQWNKLKANGFLRSYRGNTVVLIPNFERTKESLMQPLFLTILKAKLMSKQQRNIPKENLW